jgi:hypothetical protein
LEGKNTLHGLKRRIDLECVGNRDHSRHVIAAVRDALQTMTIQNLSALTRQGVLTLLHLLSIGNGCACLMEVMLVLILSASAILMMPTAV